MVDEKKQKLDISNEIDKLKLIVEHSKMHLINYFSDIKTQIDVHYSQSLIKLSSSLEKENQQQNLKYKSEWVHLIQIVDSCENICLKNKLSDELIGEAFDLIKSIESTIQNVDESIAQIHTLINKIESHLLANAFYLVLKIKKQNKLSVIIFEQGFSFYYIECLKKLYFLFFKNFYY